LTAYWTDRGFRSRTDDFETPVAVSSPSPKRGVFATDSFESEARG